MTAALSRLSLDGVTRPIQVNAIPHDDLESQGTEREGRKERMKDKKERKERRKTREKENGGGAILAGARDSHGPGRRLRPITAYT